MSKQLIVTNAFGDYAVGDRITDAVKIDAVIASDSVPNVVAVEVEDAKAAPAADPAPVAPPLKGKDSSSTASG